MLAGGWNYEERAIGLVDETRRDASEEGRADPAEAARAHDDAHRVTFAGDPEDRLGHMMALRFYRNGLRLKPVAPRQLGALARELLGVLPGGFVELAVGSAEGRRVPRRDNDVGEVLEDEHDKRHAGTQNLGGMGDRLLATGRAVVADDYRALLLSQEP
jgi:hypothetical protein